MLENLLVVCGQVATLFLMMGVGFVLVKVGWLNTQGMSQMSTILLYVVAPCIFIKSFQQEGLPGLDVLGTAVLAMGVYYLIFMPLTALLFRKTERRTGSVLRFGTLYSNSAFMGLPLLQLVLGPDAIIFGVISFVLFGIAQWTQGAIIMGGGFSLKKSFLNPAVIGLLMGLPLLLFHWRLPTVVNTAVSFMADLNSPLAMIIIGGQIAQADLTASFTQRRLYTASAIKLIAVPGLLMLILLPLRLDPVLYCTMVILTATPVAGATSIFAQRFDQDTATAAQYITLSTLLSIITLPVFAVLAQMVA
jgi:predicted permease